MNRLLAIIGLISLLSNPVYAVDSARASYRMTVSLQGNPLSMSYMIYSDITISQGGVATVIIDSGDLPFDWLDDVSPEFYSMFILPSADIASLSTIIGGTAVTLTEAKETAFVPWFGANVLVSANAPTGEFETLVLTWSQATGLVLDIHMEYVDGSDVFNIDVEYQSSNVNIYSDQGALEQFGNQVVSYFMTPTGFIVLVAIIVVVIAVAVVIARRQENKSTKTKKGEKR